MCFAPLREGPRAEVRGPLRAPPPAPQALIGWGQMLRQWVQVDREWVERREQLLRAQEDAILAAARDQASGSESAFFDDVSEDSLSECRACAPRR